MTANDSKSYLDYLSKLVDEYNNNYGHSIDEKPISADYSALSEQFEAKPKATAFKVRDRMRIIRHRNIFNKDYTGNSLKENFVIDSVLKSNSWSVKSKT